MRSSFYLFISFFGGEGPEAPLSSMIIFTISTSLQIILHGGTFFIFYFGEAAKLGALYNIDFRV